MKIEIVIEISMTTKALQSKDQWCKTEKVSLLIRLRYIADPSDHFSGQLTTPFGIEQRELNRRQIKMLYFVSQAGGPYFNFYYRVTPNFFFVDQTHSAQGILVSQFVLITDSKHARKIQ